MNTDLIVIPNEVIISHIFLIRGKKVMLDRDLAEMYGVETKVLNQAVKRNANRFPDDFMFQITDSEFVNLKSQFVTSSWGGVRKLPYAFTEQGVAMLSSVLKSDRAVQVNIQIIRIFTHLREILSKNKKLAEKIEKMERKYDGHLATIFRAIKELSREKNASSEKEAIGFKTEGK